MALSSIHRIPTLERPIVPLGNCKRNVGAASTHDQSPLGGRSFLRPSGKWTRTDGLVLALQFRVRVVACGKTEFLSLALQPLLVAFILIHSLSEFNKTLGSFIVQVGVVAARRSWQVVQDSRMHLNESGPRLPPNAC